MNDSYTVKFRDADIGVLGGVRKPNRHRNYAQDVAEQFNASDSTFVHLVEIPDFGVCRATILDSLRKACRPFGIHVHRRGAEIYLRKDVE